MLNFNSVLVSTDNAQKLADFYIKVFQKEPEMSDGGYFGFMVGSAFLSFGPHDKITGKSPNPGRILLNFETGEVQKEFERIKELGAEVIAKPYQMDGYPGWIATLADPDGNYFQLMTPWEETDK